MNEKILEELQLINRNLTAIFTIVTGFPIIFFVWFIWTRWT